MNSFVGDGRRLVWRLLRRINLVIVLPVMLRYVTVIVRLKYYSMQMIFSFVTAMSDLRDLIRRV